MAYAVLQKSPDAPSIEALKRAVHRVPGLTAYDAFSLSKEAFGIIVRGFELEAARALQNGLAAQGIPAEVVDEAALPQLPDVQFLARVDCTPEALIMHDQLGRTASLEWKDIALFAAGTVIMTEFNKLKPPHSTDSTIPGLMNQLLTDPNIGYNPGTAVTTVDTTVYAPVHEEKHERCLLEIIPTGAVVRYSVNADKTAHLLFQGLGARRTDDLHKNFALLVQDIAHSATAASINRGAYYLRENSATPFVYPSKQSFYSEIVWLLWMLGNHSQSA